ncbi:MAG: glycosyltransferase family 2 protein [Planctomycetes bacterium]|nr:glycosyltransferase family 2 protein [Planctomycetota bacterium]
MTRDDPRATSCARATRSCRTPGVPVVWRALPGHPPLKISIVIPVYNEEKTVAQAVRKVLALDLDKEVLIINDGSSDGTREALAPFESMEGVRVFHSPVNFGKGSTVRIGFAFATGEIVTIQDADLELDPRELLKLTVPIREGRADVVYGSRFMNSGRGGSLSFYIANRALAGLTNLLFGSRLTDIETCYKVLRRDVIPGLKLRASRFEIEPEMTAQLLKRGYKIIEMPIAYNARTKEQGKKISWHDGITAVLTLIEQRFWM